MTDTDPLIGGRRVVTADHLCTAAEQLLRDVLPGWAEAAGLDPVRTWQQVPTESALTSANLPGVAITSPGLTAPPRRTTRGWSATWRLAIGVYVRGKDHTTTAAATRQYAGLIRTALLQHPTLCGLATSLVWVGEEYALQPDRGAARTLGGGVVAVDVAVDDVVPDGGPVAPDDPSAEQPTVQQVRTTVTVRPASTTAGVTP